MVLCLDANVRVGKIEWLKRRRACKFIERENNRQEIRPDRGRGCGRNFEAKAITQAGASFYS